MNDTTKQWLTPKEVAEMTGFSTETIRRMCRQGRLRHVKNLPGANKGRNTAIRIPLQGVYEFFGDTNAA